MSQFTTLDVPESPARSFALLDSDFDVSTDEEVDEIEQEIVETSSLTVPWTVESVLDTDLQDVEDVDANDEFLASKREIRRSLSGIGVEGHTYHSCHARSDKAPEVYYDYMVPIATSAEDTKVTVEEKTADAEAQAEWTELVRRVEDWYKDVPDSFEPSPPKSKTKAARRANGVAAKQRHATKFVASGGKGDMDETASTTANEEGPPRRRSTRAKAQKRSKAAGDDTAPKAKEINESASAAPMSRRKRVTSFASQEHPPSLRRSARLAFSASVSAVLKPKRKKHGGVVPTPTEKGCAREEPNVPLRRSTRAKKPPQTSTPASSALQTKTGPDMKLRRSARTKQLPEAASNAMERSCKRKTRSSDDVTRGDTKRKKGDHQELRRGTRERRRPLRYRAS
ncbi:hypothetical protein Moror_1927 [Moniliophthora roreri MCA 2997]|nr:hypothetical protein Moror_1927 [Moniliophthora roreri MCA 2997]KAI3595075.1 hypothetical protein WG66_001131 [Moniliophthora roreri]